MRVTQSMYYDSIYATNNNKLTNELFDVNKQIASGLKIEYAGDDVRTFTETMRLDNEVTTLKQVKKSTESGYKVSNQTDTVLNDFSTSMDKMKTLFVNAANASQSDASVDAIATELRGLEDHLKNLANTSINGEYIFSGSAVNIKPIDEDGTYKGNEQVRNALIGSNNYQQYNISGSELFLGEEPTQNRKLTSNVKSLNQTKLYPDVMQDPSLSRSTGEEKYITSGDTIRDLMGDNDQDTTNNNPYYFYINGTKHNGSTFSQKVSFSGDQKVSELLDSIEEMYGENSVNVSLDSYGEIEIEDKLKGSSKLDFQMVGAVDFKGNDDLATSSTDLEALEDINGVVLKGFTQSEYAGNTAKIRSVEDPYNANNFSVNGILLEQPSLQKADKNTLLSDIFDSDVSKIHFSGNDVNGTPVDTDYSIGTTNTVQDLLTALNSAYDDEGNGNDYLKFNLENGKIVFQSNDTTASSNINMELEARNANNNSNVKGFNTDTFLSYDKIDFLKKNDELSSNISQIVRADNAYAVDATKLSEVADLSKGTSGTLDQTNYTLDGYDINGTKFSTTIKLDDNGSTFEVLQDTNGNGDLSDESLKSYNIYNVDGTKVKADDLTYRQFMDVINMSMTDQLPTSTDNSSDEYQTATGNADIYANVSLNSKSQIQFKELNTNNTKAQMMLYDANSPDSTLSFQSNNALTIKDPKTDFFHTLDQAISAVEEHKVHPDASMGSARNIGIQNGIQMIDDLSEHISRIHSKSGSQSNALNNSIERTTLLETTTVSLRSSVIDTDIAEASLRLSQLNLNYQAMLSTVGKVSKLSLVNYL